jgi:hypothetical protein
VSFPPFALKVPRNRCQTRSKPQPGWTPGEDLRQSVPRRAEQVPSVVCLDATPERDVERRMRGPHTRLHGRIPQAGPCSTFRRVADSREDFRRLFTGQHTRYYFTLGAGACTAREPGLSTATLCGARSSSSRRLAARPLGAAPVVTSTGPTASLPRRAHRRAEGSPGFSSVAASFWRSK